MPTTALNQLIQAQTRNAASSSLPVLTSYSYDAVGNRTVKSSSWGDVLETESYTYNDADQLMQWTNGTSIKDYRYDPRGSLLQVLEKQQTVPDASTVSASVYGMTITDSVYGSESPWGLFPEGMIGTYSWSDSKVIEQYAWDAAGRLISFSKSTRKATSRNSSMTATAIA